MLCIAVLLLVGFASYKISYTLLAKGGAGGSSSTENLKDIMDEAQTD